MCIYKEKSEKYSLEELFLYLCNVARNKLYKNSSTFVQFNLILSHF